MSQSDPSIFSLIIDGQLPCHKVYEDDSVFAFLDINPCSTGHTLVVPKEQAVTLDQLSDESAAAIGSVLPRISRAILEVTGATDFNVLQNNGEAAFQSVFHVHFHIIPKSAHQDGLEIEWSPQQLEDGESLAQEIRDAVE